MEKEVKKDILAILGRVIEILKVKEARDVVELRELSNHTIHDASIYQDLDSISIAVLVFAVYKILESGLAIPAKDYNLILSLFKRANESLQVNKFGKYNQSISGLFKAVRGLDKKIKLYIEEVLERARIKKGSKLVEHGLSIGRAAEIMGITQWELMAYMGKTQLMEKYEIRGLSVKERLAYAEGIFGLK